VGTCYYIIIIFCVLSILKNICMKKKLLLVLCLLPFTTIAQFHCGDTFYDSRNGMSYPTVMIGNQCWFAKNLDIGTMLNVVAVNLNQTNNGIFEKFCYNNDSTNCKIYGGLYQWNEAMNYKTIEKSKGLCPEGWHIPSQAEFDTLVANFGTSSAGKALQVGGVSGFNALASGYCYFNYQKWVFGSLGVYGVIRTSSQGSTTDYAWVNYYYPNDSAIYKTASYKKTNGYSIRCISDFPAGIKEKSINYIKIKSIDPEEITLELPDFILPARYVVKIFSVDGELIRQSENSSHHEIRVNISGISTGIYIIAVFGDNIVFTPLKFVKVP